MDIGDPRHARAGSLSSSALFGSVQDITEMMMQESPGAAGIGSIGSADQFAGRYKDQQRSKANPGAEDQGLKCPRCDSPNTKFCYYNNYNLTQPRHFCKTCRRYWTKGGALRNVPIGGGCRKNKRPKQRTASKDRTPLIIALDHRENSSSPAANSAPAMDVSNGLSLLQNLWAPSGSNYLGLPGTDRVGLALARLQNHSNLLGPGVNGDGRYGHPSGGHMATLMFENPPAAPQDNVLAGVPSSSSAGMLVEGIAAAGSNFNFAGPESFDGNGTGAEDLMHWRIQQQSRLAMLQLAAADGQTVDANNNHNSGNNNNNNNNVDLLPISSVNDQNYSSNSGPQKGKSIISNDLQTRVNDYDGRPGPEWPAVADCLFEPQAVPGESTGGYWYGLQQLAEN